MFFSINLNFCAAIDDLNKGFAFKIILHQILTIFEEYFHNGTVPRNRLLVVIYFMVKLRLLDLLNGLDVFIL